MRTRPTTTTCDNSSLAGCPAVEHRPGSTYVHSTVSTGPRCVACPLSWGLSMRWCLTYVLICVYLRHVALQANILYKAIEKNCCCLVTHIGGQLGHQLRTHVYQIHVLRPLGWTRPYVVHIFVFSPPCISSLSLNPLTSM